jgi:hypothetical protein
MCGGWRWAKRPDFAESEIELMEPAFEAIEER